MAMPCAVGLGLYGIYATYGIYILLTVENILVDVIIQFKIHFTLLAGECMGNVWTIETYDGDIKTG